MTRMDPNPMTADQIASGIAQGQHIPWALMSPQQVEELAASLDNTSVQQLYRARYQAHFLRQGNTADQAKSKAAYWASLKVNPPAGMTVVDPDLSVDDLIMQHRLQRGEIDPSTVTPTAIYPQAIMPAPMVRMEMPNLLGRRFAVNAFALSPARDYWAQAAPGAHFLATAEPQLFNSSGALPSFTASGLPPETLTQIHWSLRHSAAFSESKAHVLEMVEASGADRMDYEQDLDYAQLQNPRGRDHLGDYLARAHAWALGTAAEPVSDADIDSAWEDLGGYPGAPRQLPNAGT